MGREDRLLDLARHRFLDHACAQPGRCGLDCRQIVSVECFYRRADRFARLERLEEYLERMGGYGSPDLLEDRCPGRIGDLADEDIALLEPADLVNRADHPRRAFGDAV